MFRARAVKQLLLEDIAGLAEAAPTEGEVETTSAEAEVSDDSRSRLARAQRRALLVAVLDWIAIIVLVIVRARSGEGFVVGPTEESIFSIGLLAIAVHSGFRIGQLEKLRAVERALDDMDSRST